MMVSVDFSVGQSTIKCKYNRATLLELKLTWQNYLNIDSGDHSSGGARESSYTGVYPSHIPGGSHYIKFPTLTDHLPIRRDPL